MASPAYRPRKPKASPLWHCLFRHFDAFLGLYEECYCKRYGFLRPIITEVVNKFLDCGLSACGTHRQAISNTASHASAATIAKRGYNADGDTFPKAVRDEAEFIKAAFEL